MSDSLLNVSSDTKGYSIPADGYSGLQNEPSFASGPGDVQPIERLNSGNSGQPPHIFQNGFGHENYELIDAQAINVSRLKHASQASALLSGFAMIAFVEIGFEPDTPQWLMIIFGIVTTTLISVHLWALMVSTCLLPNLDSYNKYHLRRQRIGSNNLQCAADPELSPHKRFRNYIITAWFFSTGVGIVLFLAEVIVVAWMRFITISPATAWAVTIIVTPLLVLFTYFARHFHNTVIELQLAVHDQALTQGLQSVGQRDAELHV